METSLYNWIDKSKTSLVQYPRMLDSWNIVASIIKDWRDVNIVVVTDRKSELQELVNEDLIIYTYSQFDEITQVIFSDSVDVVISDDISMLSNFSSALSFPTATYREKATAPNIIVMTTWGDDIDKIKAVSSKLLGEDVDMLKHLLTIDFIHDISKIEYTVQEIELNPDHLVFYEANVNPATTLYLYPEELREISLLSCASGMCIRQSTNKDIAMDYVVEDNGWIQHEHYKQLNLNGPKIKVLIDNIKEQHAKYRDNKQIVITRYDERYGVYLLASMIRRAGLSVITITSKDVEKNEAKRKLDVFNKSKSAILVTSVVPFVDLVGVTNIAIIDNYSIDVYKTFLQRIHKNRCCRASKSKPGVLDVDIYIAVYPGKKGKTIDQDLFIKFDQRSDEYDALYDNMRARAQKIVYNSRKTGLVVRG